MLESSAVSDETGAAARRPLLRFFLLTFVITIPFWLLGAFTKALLLPGLPIAALSFVCPGLAATILIYREAGRSGVRALLKRSLDIQRARHKRWLIPAVLLVPVIVALSYAIMRLTGVYVPEVHISPVSVVLLIVLFFIAAVGEELGWSGYAIEPMQKKWGAMQASLLLGAIWAVYHYIALVQAHHPIMWIMWWTLHTVALRLLIVWIFYNTGKSIFAASLMHMSLNVSWQLFPANGSHFDEFIVGTLLAAAALIVCAVWDTKTLSYPKWRKMK